MKPWRIAVCLVFATLSLRAQDADHTQNDAGYVPVISGGMGYVQNVDGGVTSLEPQIVPVLLVPFGQHVLLESRVAFTGFFQREDRTYGPFTGKVYKTVEYAQLDWLANTHVTASVGMYLLPFGLYNERLDPIWIRNLQDPPITAAIGTETSGAGDGIMFRGALRQTPAYSIQYSTYFSARSGINQIGAARTAGGDGSIFLNKARLEIGGSYQRFLQGRHYNSEAAYLSWQPPRLPMYLMAEYDQGYTGRGYWLESGYFLSQAPWANSFFKRVQTVGRMQQTDSLHGGGNGISAFSTQRVDFGLNYYFRYDFRFISSYGRQFVHGGNANVWNVGFTYRFLWPLWPGKG